MSDIYITWDDYNKKIEELAIKVYQDGCKFNQVICIAKGGLRVGDIFSRLFDVPLAIMSVESYKKGTGNILDQQGQFTFSRDLAKTTPNLGSHVLLVDDLADSGFLWVSTAVIQSLPCCFQLSNWQYPAIQ